MVGSAIALEAKLQNFEVIGKPSHELDLTDRKAVFDEISRTRPDFLIIAAAKVGGIGANSSFPVPVSPNKITAIFLFFATAVATFSWNSERIIPLEY